MRAVDEVHIGVSGRAEEDLVALGFSSGRMGCEIALAEINFDLHDAARQPLLHTVGQCPNENFPQQLPCYDARVASIKALRQYAFFAQDRFHHGNTEDKEEF